MPLRSSSSSLSSSSSSSNPPNSNHHHESPSQPKSSSALSSNDEAVILTADDALLSKLSASSMGYYDDPFTPYMARNAVITGVSSGSRSKRQQNSSISRHSHNYKRRHDDAGTKMKQQRHQQPIIRRGTHARVCCIDRALSHFLSLSSPPTSNGDECSSNVRQVVVLGAGKDTSYFRYRAGLLTSQQQPSSSSSSASSVVVRWYDVDREEVMISKRQLLMDCPETKRLWNEESVQDDDDDATTAYHLVSYDLRDPPSNLFHLLSSSSSSFQNSVPTLFILECVQMYLPENNSQSLLQSITQHCLHPLLALYDPLLGHDDAFGNIMQKHLTNARIITSPDISMLHNRTLEERLNKLLLDCHFEIVVGCDMLKAYETVVGDENRRRANRCEMLDEWEEWTLIMSHYCFIVAGGKGWWGEEFCRVGDEEGSAAAAAGGGGGLGFEEGKCVRRLRTGS